MDEIAYITPPNEDEPEYEPMVLVQEGEADILVLDESSDMIYLKQDEHDIIYLQKSSIPQLIKLLKQLENGK